jgi:hypothetical protein
MASFSRFGEPSKALKKTDPSLIVNTGLLCFDDPIPLPSGRQLITLQDVATYVMKLPKADQNLPEGVSTSICKTASPRLEGKVSQRINILF